MGCQKNLWQRWLFVNAFRIRFFILLLSVLSGNNAVRMLGDPGRKEERSEGTLASLHSRVSLADSRDGVGTDLSPGM